MRFVQRGGTDRTRGCCQNIVYLEIQGRANENNFLHSIQEKDVNWPVLCKYIGHASEVFSSIIPEMICSAASMPR